MLSVLFREMEVLQEFLGAARCKPSHPRNPGVDEASKSGAGGLWRSPGDSYPHNTLAPV